MRLEAVFEPNIEVVCLGVAIPLLALKRRVGTKSVRALPVRRQSVIEARAVNTVRLDRKRLAVRSGLRMVEVRMTRSYTERSLPNTQSRPSNHYL